MTSFFRWQVAALVLTVGLALQSTASSEELCPQCAQKDSFSSAQKHDHGGKGGKGAAQKGHVSRGFTHKTMEHKWFYSHHPPAAPVLDSVAVRRVPVPRQTNFRIQQESGQLRADPRPESGAAPEDVNNINQRLDALEKHVTRLYDSLDKLVTQLQQ